MVFSSSIFLFFFLPLVILGYYLLKENYRVYFLLLASLFFYAWGEPKYVLIMFLSIIINYSFGMFIHNNRSNKNLSKILLVLSAACNLGILFYFKYLNFTLQTVNGILDTGFAYRNIVMPIGISFFTFQGMSYVIDLYRRQVDVQKNPGKLAFYISFFPQLIAGPIVRYIDIEKQLNERTESLDKFVSGAQRFIIGLAKKVIIANTMGASADFVFMNPAVENMAAAAWLGIICYMFQIYFDFSGYSDMAIGLGRLFGFEFLENFNYPYISKTVTEFWRRWHISLSSWFRDYVYIPLGGNKKGNVYINLFLVFVLTGFWHGASWNFLAWGLWHGFFLIVERLFGIREVKNKKFVPLRTAATLLIVLIGWVFFRAPDLKYALNYLGIMFGLVRPEKAGLTLWFYLSPKIVIMLCLAAAASTPLLKRLFKREGQINNPAANGKPTVQYLRFGRALNSSTRINNVVKKCTVSVLYLVLFFVCIVFVTASSYNPFIYFRF